MKKLMIISFALVFVAATCQAGVKVLGQGDSKTFDSANFPPAMKTKYEVIKTKCVRCHTLERVVEAITTGVSPISGAPFDRNAVKAYGAKMMRKSDSHMNRQEIIAAMELMNYLLEQAAK